MQSFVFFVLVTFSLGTGAENHNLPKEWGTSPRLHRLHPKLPAFFFGGGGVNGGKWGQDPWFKSGLEKGGHYERGLSLEESLEFVPRGIAEWSARVDCVRWTLAIGDWRFCNGPLIELYTDHFSHSFSWKEEFSGWGRKVYVEKVDVLCLSLGLSGREGLPDFGFAKNHLEFEQGILMKSWNVNISGAGKRASRPLAPNT